MELIYNFVTILQGVSISLGVGCSTLAVLNFFVAIKDGTIDKTERTMMGIVYVVLRVAMGLILMTTFIQGLVAYSVLGSSYFSTIALAMWTLISMLFLNALLMTKRIMPSTLGPAIQAGSWYSFGILSALISARHTDFTYLQFFLAYLSALGFAAVVINGFMLYQKRQRIK